MDKASMGILKEYIQRGSYAPALHGINNGQLYPDQVAGVMFSLLCKKNILAADTGLGKTVMAAAIINMVVKSEKAIFVLKRFTIEEICKKLTRNLRSDLTLGWITDQEDVIRPMVRYGRASVCNVLVISSDAVANPEVNKYLYSIRHEIKVVFVDEIHLFANFESVESRLMAKLIEVSEYAYPLSATPFERDIQQLINCCYHLNNNIYGGESPRTFGNRFKIYDSGVFMGYRNVELLKKILSPMIFRLARQDSVDCAVHRVVSKPQWRQIKDYEARRVIKLDTTGEPYYKLMQLVHKYTSQGKKGLIYANFNDVKRMLYGKLTESGYKVGVVDGSVSKELKQERSITSYLFNQNHYQLLITNRSVSLDQECDFVIFYEATQQYLQVIGRACRSFKEKSINVDIILAAGTYDEEFFMRNAYPKITMIATILEKDISSLEGAVKGDKKC